MGAIYEVIDIKTQRRRALKLMLPSIVADEDMRARFKLEATVTANIESEHIVETFDADVDDETGAPYLVMELLRGKDLADILSERTRLAPPEVILMLAQAARALDKTHAAGIVHRDLKPENLFITRRDDGSIRVKILDFGIAKVIAASEGQQKKQQTINLGTPPYMSPEQILGDATIDHRADIYAIGHIAYALLVGEPYWLEESRNGDTLYRLLLRMVDGVKEPPTVRAQRYGVNLPPTFDTWFLRATAKNPGERFERASDLVMALGEVLNVPLQHRAIAPSVPDSEWEIDSLMLPKGAVQQLVSVPPDAPGSISTPQAQAVSIISVPSIPSLSGLSTPASSVSTPLPGPSIPPLHSIVPTNPTPVETHIEVPAAQPQKPARPPIWALMVIALVLGFAGVMLVSRVIGSSPTDKNGSPTGDASSASIPRPIASVLEAGTPGSAAESPPPVVAISASATSSASTALPPSPSTGKTGPSSKQKIPGPNPTTKSSSGKYDPLRQL